ncbi:MAG: Mur ligase family protein, partial [Spirochaetales bacterium]|nr:Mur ligase family protein [Spirochaetales bacterium]
MNDISITLSDFFDSYSPSLSGGLRENRLERMNLLLERIGNPEKELKMIHIAGSKGKGTTASFMSWIMNQYHMKTGLYLSPHVFDIRERFTLGTKFFPQSLYISTLKELKKKIEGFSLPQELGPDMPTTFELYTAYAYLLFKNAGCKYAVIETGLGGRLDATNTISPIATCFTYIEKEHTKILGNTLEEIATEKAGIMRKGVPSFFSDMPQEALDTLKKEADRIGSPYLTYALKIKDLKFKNNFPIKIAHTKIQGIDIAFEATFGFSEIELYDLYYVLFILQELNLLKHIDRNYLELKDGFSLPGRFQRKTLITDEKTVSLTFDGAHTPSSIQHLLDNIEAYNFYPCSTLVFSTAIDKNYKEMADIIVPKF